MWVPQNSESGPPFHGAKCPASSVPLCVFRVRPDP